MLSGLFKLHIPGIIHFNFFELKVLFGCDFLKNKSGFDKAASPYFSFLFWRQKTGFEWPVFRRFLFHL